MAKKILEKTKELFNSNQRIILAHLIKHTNENQGLTVYDLSQRLELSPGNVLQHLNSLLKKNKIKKTESTDTERGKIAYYMPENIKKDLTNRYAFLKIDMYSEVKFVGEKLLDEGKKTFYEDIRPSYFSLTLIAADANNYLKYLADCQYNSFTVYQSDIGMLGLNGRFAELEDYYGLTFYAIKHSITTKFLFEFINRNFETTHRLDFTYKSEWFSMLPRYIFLENGRALMNRSDDIIDRMFRKVDIDITFEFRL